MSSHDQAKIDIGGTVSRESLSELWDAVEGRGLGNDWVEPFNDIDGLLNLIAYAEEDQDSLTITCNTYSMEDFADIKQWCIKHGCSYYVVEDAMAEGPEMVTWWAPGMETEANAPGNRGLSCIEVEELAKVDSMEGLRKLIKAHTPCEIPRFIVEDKEG